MNQSWLVSRCPGWCPGWCPGVPAGVPAWPRRCPGWSLGVPAGVPAWPRPQVSRGVPAGAQVSEQAEREHEAELDTVHAHFMATAKVELEQLLQTFPAPRNWTRRDTQASLCAFSRYLHVRRSLLDPSVPLVKARIYANAPTWPL